MGLRFLSLAYLQDAMPDFDITRGLCSVQVKCINGDHYVHWIESNENSDPFDYIKTMKALKKESAKRGIEKLFFFIEPSNTRLLLLYDKLGAQVEAVVMSYGVPK